jgi:hypothetical protein
MEWRGKRSQSGPKPAASQRRRRIVDNHHRENLLRTLIIEPNIDNTAGHLVFPGKSRLLVKDEWWAKFSQDASKIPLYILEIKYDEKYSIGPHHDSEKELVHESIPRESDVIVVGIMMSRKGVTFLQTSKCETITKQQQTKYDTCSRKRRWVLSSGLLRSFSV